MWFTVLYVSLLTILVLVLGVFSGYILSSLWQMDQSNNSTIVSLRGDIKRLKEGRLLLVNFRWNVEGTMCYIVKGLLCVVISPPPSPLENVCTNIPAPLYSINYLLVLKNTKTSQKISCLKTIVVFFP